MVTEAVERARSNAQKWIPGPCKALVQSAMHPPPPLYKLRPCPSYSRCRDRINLVPDLIWYKCSAATQDTGLVTNLPLT